MNEQQAKLIIDEWRREIQTRSPKKTGARWLDQKLPEIMNRLIQSLSEASASPPPLKRETTATVNLPEALNEYSVLREVLLRYLQQDAPLSCAHQLAIHQIIDEGLDEAVELFLRYLDSNRRFFSNVSRELRGSSNLITGYGRLLLDPEISSEEQILSVERIVTNGENLAKALEEFSHLAEIPTGTVQKQSTVIQLRPLVENIVAQLQEIAQLRGTYLILNPDEFTFPSVWSDASLLRPIMMEMMTFALESLTSGGVRVSLRAEPAPNHKLCVFFELRPRGTLTKPRPYPRLPILHGWADSLDGEITEWDASESDTNDRFYQFTFIGEIAKQDLHEAAGRSDLLAENMLTGMRVLLVDDSPDNLYLVKRLLVQKGVLVDAVSSGKGALEHAKEDVHQAILMDLQMPEMSGYQALAALRAQGFRNPVIALTADAMAEDLSRTRLAGFAAHVAKPIQSEQLYFALAGLRAARESEERWKTTPKR